MALNMLASCTVVNVRPQEKQETKMWNAIDIFVFLAHGHGNISVKLLSIEGLKALRFKQKHLNLCSDDERRTYGVWNDIRVSNK